MIERGGFSTWPICSAKHCFAMLSGVATSREASYGLRCGFVGFVRNDDCILMRFASCEIGPMATKATRIFMVRHGATVLSAEDRFAGVTDVELSEEGREQARDLAERLSRQKITAVYASPLGRTVETARILAAPHNLPLQKCDGFREISHGHWGGMTRRGVEEDF